MDIVVISVLFLILMALAIPVWNYYIGVPIFSVFVFTGIYRDASSKLDGLRSEGGN